MKLITVKHHIQAESLPSPISAPFSLGFCYLGIGAKTERKTYQPANISTHLENKYTEPQFLLGSSTHVSIQSFFFLCEKGRDESVWQGRCSASLSHVIMSCTAFDWQVDGTFVGDGSIFNSEDATTKTIRTAGWLTQATPPSAERPKNKNPCSAEVKTPTETFFEEGGEFLWTGRQHGHTSPSSQHGRAMQTFLPPQSRARTHTTVPNDQVDLYIDSKMTWYQTAAHNADLKRAFFTWKSSEFCQSEKWIGFLDRVLFIYLFFIFIFIYVFYFTFFFFKFQNCWHILHKEQMHTSTLIPDWHSSTRLVQD